MFPTYGGTKFKGKSQGGGKLNITAQVADVTKPLALADEVVSADTWIILNKKGGAMAKFGEEGPKELRKILERSKGNIVPIHRRNGTLTMEISVKEDEWQKPKKTVKEKTVKMDVDQIENTNYW